MSTPTGFTSFPTFSSFPDLEAGPSKETPRKAPTPPPEAGKRREDRKDNKRSEKGSSKHKRSRDNHDKSGQQNREQDVSIHRHTPNESKPHDYAQWRAFEREAMSDITPRSVFYSDKKGDSLNVKYGRIHAGDIPKYTLWGRGRKILGLANAFTVVHRGRNGVEVDVGKRRKLPALTDPSSRRLLRAPPTKRYIATAGDKYKYSEVDGFLRLPDSGKRRTAQPARDITTLEPESDSSESLPSGDEDGDSDDSDAAPLTSRQAALKALEAQLAAEPTSIPTWLSLLSHTISAIPFDSKNANRARSEVALSVLSRALAAHPDNAKSEQLRLKYIHAGEEIWTEDTLETEWERALQFAGSELWIRWLDWRMRTARRGVDGMVQDAHKVLSRLSPEDENARLRALWRAAIAFRDAGFVERANAIFQAQAELAFQRPSSLETASFGEVLDHLEEFWESEVPRVGEIGATGWSKWAVAGKPDNQGSASAQGPTKAVALDPYVRWALDERATRQSTHSLPARNAADDPDSDPYATILFSDIRPFLLDMRSDRSKQNFRLIWLSFSGVVIPGLSGSLHGDPGICADDKWSATRFATPEFLSALFPHDANARQITADAQAGELVGREREYSNPLGPVKHWTFGVFDPLERIGSESYSMFTREDLAGVDVTLVREIFRHAKLSTTDDQWHILHLAIEGALDVKTALKASKAYLASSKDSLPHWSAHARLEQLRGRPNEARKVYTTVLPAAGPIADGAATLWWDWAELEWLSRNTEAAIQVIMRSSYTRGSGTVALLRCKKRLDELHNEAPASHWRDRLAWLKLRALLEILTTSIESAISILDSRLTLLSEGSLMHEALTVSTLLMLHIQGSVLRNPLPPALLRDRAETAITTYPSNTAILGLFLEAQKGQAVWGKARLVLGENTATGVARDKDLPRRVAEVWAAGWEKGRWKAEEERTRTSLSTAAQDERTRGSPILWRLYLEFEIRAGQLARAKKLLFRAIGECPLVKELYLMGFLQLRSIFNTSELRELAETMAERGIRLRESLDEALGDWEELASAAVSGGKNAEDAGDEDIEYRAEEYRRLRPY